MEKIQLGRRISGFRLLGNIMPFIFSAPDYHLGIHSGVTHGVPFRGNHSSGKFKKNLRKVKKRQRRRAHIKSL